MCIQLKKNSSLKLISSACLIIDYFSSHMSKIYSKYLYFPLGIELIKWFGRVITILR